MVNAFITVDPEETVAVAVALEDGGVNVTVGDNSDGNAYPLPPPVITGAPIEVGDINAVAIPPVPNAFWLRIVIVGTSVYPYPGFVTSIRSIDCPVCPLRLVIIATAVALIPSVGAVDIPIKGAIVYPVPSLIKSIRLTEFPVVRRLKSFANCAVAVAAAASTQTIVKLVENPNSTAALTTSSIPLSILSSRA